MCRKFWRHELVRLQYHNPSIAMQVERHTNNDPKTTDATMSISFAPATSTTDSISPTPSERTETINMLNLTNSQILSELRRITNGSPVEATAEEQQELRLLEEQRLRGERDRRASLEVRARVKREKELLEQARGQLAAEGA